MALSHRKYINNATISGGRASTRIWRQKLPPSLADDNIAKQAETGALHEQTGEPTCDGANNQGYDQSCKHDLFPP